MKTRSKAFTLVEIMIVVAIIGILIAIAVPGFIRAREVSRRNSCQENLTKIDGAKSTWALEMNMDEGSTPEWVDLVKDDMTGFLRYKPICPLDQAKDGSTYEINAVNVLPACTSNADSTDFKHTYPDPGLGAGSGSGT